MLRPLRWASGSLSLLPEKLSDLLAAPSPLLVGLTQELTELQPGFAYFDFAEQSVQVTGNYFPLVPKYAQMEKALRAVWQGKADCTEILTETSATVGHFLGPVKLAIVSQIDESGSVSSRFCREEYLKAFAPQEKAFAEEFARTQMFQLQIEQDCRRRSDVIAGGSE
jgi:hypothetical protein